MTSEKPKQYRATVALVKPIEESTEDDQFRYIDRFYDSPIAARLWAAKLAKNHPLSSGSATVHRRIWEWDEAWLLADEDCVWSM